MSSNIKVATPDTKAKLDAYMTESGLTLKQVGRKLGKSEAMVSRYLGDNPAGDIEAFESAILDMLAAETRKQQWDDVYFGTRAIDECFLMFDLIRSARDVGIVSSAPGCGKSVACARYAALNATALMVSVPKWAANPYGMQRLLWFALDTRKYDPSAENKAEYLVRRLSGSERLLIIDNAQRIPVSGLQWLLDFADATRCPVALVGNPAQILDRLRSDPALSSRIGIRKDISSDGKDKEASAWLSDASDSMVKAMWPDAASEIKTLAREAARQPGHLRRLNKQLRIAIRLAESPAWGKSRAAAFAYSRTLLVDDGSDD
jgi:DNA transposition AAA+ family ATPase